MLVLVLVCVCACVRACAHVRACVCVCVCVCVSARAYHVYGFMVCMNVCACYLTVCVRTRCLCMSVHARHNANIHSMQTTCSAQVELSVQRQGVHDDVASRLQQVGTETPRGWEERERHSPPFKAQRCHRHNDAAYSRKE